MFTIETYHFSVLLLTFPENYPLLNVTHQVSFLCSFLKGHSRTLDENLKAHVSSINTLGKLKEISKAITEPIKMEQHLHPHKMVCKEH